MHFVLVTDNTAQFSMQLYWAAQVTFLPKDFAAVGMLNSLNCSNTVTGLSCLPMPLPKRSSGSMLSFSTILQAVTPFPRGYTSRASSATISGCCSSSASAGGSCDCVNIARAGKP